jgi:hypothetical protein
MPEQTAGVREDGPKPPPSPPPHTQEAVTLGDRAVADSDDGRRCAAAIMMAELLQTLAADGVEWVRAESLYLLDCLPGYL